MSDSDRGHELDGATIYGTDPQRSGRQVDGIDVTLSGCYNRMSSFYLRCWYIFQLFVLLNPHFNGYDFFKTYNSSEKNSTAAVSTGAMVGIVLAAVVVLVVIGVIVSRRSTASVVCQ